MKWLRWLRRTPKVPTSRSVRWRLHVARLKAADPTWHWGHPDDWPDEEWWDYCRTSGGSCPSIPGWFR